MAAVDILSDARRKKDERSKEICSSCTQCSNGIFHGRKRIRSSEKLNPKMILQEQQSVFSLVQQVTLMHLIMRKMVLQ